MTETEWIIELEDFPNYFVSNLGKVYSKKNGRHGESKELKEKISCFNKGTGYQRIILYKNGKSYGKSVHRLVCERFLEKVKDKPFVDHIDRNRLNNNLSNLKWVNSRENSINRGISNRNTSGVKGIYYNKIANRWVCSYSPEANKEKIKHFKNKEDAINFRKEMEKKYYV